MALNIKTERAELPGAQAGCGNGQSLTGAIAQALDGLKGKAPDRFSTLWALRSSALMPDEAKLAREAYKRFGRGNHPARLNLGDCFAYPRSKSRGEPLLFKGDDLRQSDVEATV